MCKDLYEKELSACSDMMILMSYFVNRLRCFYSVSYWTFFTLAVCGLCLQTVTEDMVSVVGTVHGKKGAHTDKKQEEYRREVTSIFVVVEFWHILGDPTCEEGAYISLFTGSHFGVKEEE